ncbi:MAG: hypothetical protein U0354_13200 [Candidatus Sericytochromatia bacterium]
MFKKKVLNLLVCSSFISLSLSSNTFAEGFEDLINNGNNSENTDKVDPNKNSTIPPMFPEYKAETAPKVMKTSITLSGGKGLVYWKNPNAKEPEYNTWTWYPRIKFDIAGPISAGSQVYVDFLKPNGKLWLSKNCETQELQAGYIGAFKTEDFTEKEAIKDIGNFKFAIKLKNELEGTNKTLYTGTYKVTKFHVGNNLPQFKNQFEYVVDQDWTMPIGYLILKKDGDYVGRFAFATWVKGDDNTYNYSAYLYHNGKMVANTKNGNGEFASYGGGTVSTERSITTGGIEKEPQWHLMKNYFSYAILYNTDPNSSFKDFHNLSKNVGEYEVKVLREGKLARTAKFTVTSQGGIKHDFGEWTSKSEYWIPITTKITSNQDQKFNPNAYKSNMYFGNPVNNIIK